MKTYFVEGKLTISVYTKVKAESEKEAIRIAGDRGHDWANSLRYEDVWVNDGYDGDIFDKILRNDTQKETH